MSVSSLLLKSIYLPPLRKLFLTPLSLLLWQKKSRTVANGQTVAPKTMSIFKHSFITRINDCTSKTPTHLWENKETYLTLLSMGTPLIVEKATLHVTDNISYKTLTATFPIKHRAQQPKKHAVQLQRTEDRTTNLFNNCVTIWIFVNYFYFHDQHFM